MRRRPSPVLDDPSSFSAPMHQLSRQSVLYGTMQRCLHSTAPRCSASLMGIDPLQREVKLMTQSRRRRDVIFGICVSLKGDSRALVSV